MKKYLFLLLFIPCLGFSQTSSLIDSYIREKVKSKGFSGTVLIAQKGKIIYENAFGFANKEWDIRNTLETKFRIGSNTKQFTAAAILQLVDKGLLNLDDRLNTFFPGYPKGDSVTITMLLNHSSGIRNYGIGPAFAANSTLPLSKDAVIALFKNLPYEFSPGSRWAYNNSAYFLLGCIVEQVSGKSFGNYLQESLLSPAGMSNSGMNNLDSILKFRAMGYVNKRSGWKNASYISMEIPFTAGAMYSTAEDLYKWYKALYAGKIVSDKSLVLMQTPSMNNYGFGLRIDSFHSHKRVGHSGTIPGFESHLAWFPEDDLTIILLSNNESDVSFIAEDIEGIIYKKPKVEIDSSMLDAYAGNYRLTENQKFVFTRAGSALRFMDGEEPIELYPIAHNGFVYGFARRRSFTFVKDKTGKMKLQFTRNGVMTELERIEAAK